jgi:rhomboid protease GluP
MNMFALWILGPFAEFALGFRRYLFVYLLAGIGSMGTVMALAAGPKGEELAVGASGCIMGLVGATGALMLRGWMREKAHAARRRLIAVILVICMQTVFDALIPQVSMTAHLSGAVLGFIGTLLLRDKLVVAAQ